MGIRGSAVFVAAAGVSDGGKDEVVPPTDDRWIFAAFKAAGAPVQYTEFPEANHNSWDATYRHDAMWQWLFAQRRH